MKEFKLDNHKIDAGFKIPDNYFDTFPDKVMKVLPASEPKVIPFFGSGRWIFAAAAILILALALPILNKLTVSSQPNITELENYISYHSSISDEDIVDLLETEDIEKIKIEQFLEDKAVEDILTSDADLEHYILN